MQPSSNRRLALIGGVGLATAGVITLLLVRDKPADEDRREFSQPLGSLPVIPKPLPALASAPVAAPSTTVATTTPSAKDKAKAADDLEAEAKAQADAAAKQARTDDAAAKQGRAKAITQARKVGILGKFQQGGAFASLTGGSSILDANGFGGLGPIGPIGGGTGVGTIGTGRGSGLGMGYGVGGERGSLRGRMVAVVSIGQPSVEGTGGLDKAIIRGFINRYIQKFQYCYEKELLVKPSLQGVVSTRFTITETGVVATASASGVDPTVSSCVANAIKGIQFAKPKGTGGVTVTYPFTFRRAATP